MTTKILSLLLVTGLSLPAFAKPLCAVFHEGPFPKGVRDLYLIAPEPVKSRSVYHLIARDPAGRLVAGAQFVCRTDSREISLCSQDDDFGSFMVSWDGEISLQGSSFKLADEKNRLLHFEGPREDDRLDDLVFYGRKSPCEKNFRLPAFAPEKKMKTEK